MRIKYTRLCNSVNVTKHQKLERERERRLKGKKWVGGNNTSNVSIKEKERGRKKKESGSFCEYYLKSKVLHPVARVVCHCSRGIF